MNMPETKPDTAAIQYNIQQSARQIVALHENVRRTFTLRDRDLPSRAAWESACAAFHAQYPDLLYPRGGEKACLADLASNDAFAIEYALCFVELRPYFFRSGYWYQKLLRRLNHVRLTPEQSQRHQYIQNAYRAYRLQKRKQP